jgi:hypothetical protein
MLQFVGFWKLTKVCLRSVLLSAGSGVVPMGKATHCLQQIASDELVAVTEAFRRLVQRSPFVAAGVAGLSGNVGVLSQVAPAGRREMNF